MTYEPEMRKYSRSSKVGKERPEEERGKDEDWRGGRDREEDCLGDDSSE